MYEVIRCRKEDGTLPPSPDQSCVFTSPSLYPSSSFSLLLLLLLSALPPPTSAPPPPSILNLRFPRQRIDPGARSSPPSSYLLPLLHISQTPSYAGYSSLLPYCSNFSIFTLEYTQQRQKKVDSVIALLSGKFL